MFKHIFLKNNWLDHSQILYTYFLVYAVSKVEKLVDIFADRALLCFLQKIGTSVLFTYIRVHEAFKKKKIINDNCSDYDAYFANQTLLAKHFYQEK